MGVSRIYKHRFLLRFFIVLALLFTFSASCATREMVVREDEREILRRRIEEYWRLKIDGHSEKAYQYLVPAYREKHSILQYAAQFRLLKYIDAEVMEIEIDRNRAQSITDVTYSMFIKSIKGKELKRIERERWAKVKGMWYHVPEGFELNSK